MNKPYRLVGVNIEINRIKEAEEKILYLSYHDQLTGLYNHRFYEEELKRLDTERNLPISIIMADVNGLKLANDAFGHMVGDELLKKASDIFKNSCRADEIIARIGGDEFVIVLPKTDYQKAQLLTNRLFHLTSSEKIADLFYLSISFGCASKTKAIEDIYEIFKKAEDSMYQQKSAVGLENKKKTIEIVLATLFERFPGEKNHAEKVRHICIAVGESMKLNPYELDALKLAAIMHDIGKISLNQEILCKPEKLDHKEWIEIKRHAEMGYRITGSVHEFSPIAKYVLHHHERWDGLGYPDGLKGEEIPLPSRIISVADAFSEMTCDRPFRNALSKEKAIQEIAKNSGTQFDPMVAEKFFEIVGMF
jgi:diguanylate cyclase (GGDEF)-like protein